MQTALGRTIKRRRKALGRTMRQVAMDLDVTERTYARWEAGHDFPRADHVEKLQAYYGVPLPERG